MLFKTAADIHQESGQGELLWQLCFSEHNELDQEKWNLWGLNGVNCVWLWSCKSPLHVHVLFSDLRCQ